MAVNVPGGWTVDPQMQACKLPEPVATAFTQATANLRGATYTPVLYCGFQVVNGNKYMLICKQVLATKDPVPQLTTMTIYAPIQGDAAICAIEPFPPFCNK